MRKLLFILMCIMSFCTKAQTNPSDGLLFGLFEKGLIKYRNNTQLEAILNYNTIEQEFLFLSGDSTILALANPQNVDMITIGKRHFIPMENDMFYEVLNAGNINFFVKWESKFVSKGKRGAYGGYSGSSAISNVSLHRSGGSIGVGLFGRLIPDEQFKANTDCVYFIVIDSSFKKFISLKTYLKYFKKDKEQIKAFAEKQRINFDNPDEVCELVKYTYSL